MHDLFSFSFFVCWISLCMNRWLFSPHSWRIWIWPMGSSAEEVSRWVLGSGTGLWERCIQTRPLGTLGKCSCTHNASSLDFWTRLCCVAHISVNSGMMICFSAALSHNSVIIHLSIYSAQSNRVNVAKFINNQFNSVKSSSTEGSGVINTIICYER